LLEVLDSFGILVEYRGGIAFLMRLHEKIIDPCPLWDQAILARVVTLLKHDNGCALLLRVIAANHSDPSAMDHARALLSAFDARPDQAARDLLTALIELYKENTMVLAPLIHHSWGRGSDTYFLRELIERAPARIWHGTVENVLADPLPFCGDPNWTGVVVAVLRRGTGEDQDAIFGALIGGFAELAKGEPEWQIAHEMVSVGTVRQKLRMAAAIQGKVVDGRCVQVAVHLLWSIPAQARRIFVEKVREAITALEDKRLADAIVEMEKVDQCNF
jgi:hypothetical protein